MRHKARVSVLQLLYQMDIGGDLKIGASPEDVHQAMGRYWESFNQFEPADREFTERMVQGVTRELEYIDSQLTKLSHHWKISRMDRVDRNALRLAAYEIWYCPDIPAKVSINEAIELVKQYSGKDSASFVNGILDQLIQQESPHVATSTG